jgi:hypothetical protein
VLQQFIALFGGKFSMGYQLWEVIKSRKCSEEMKLAMALSG